MAERDFRKEFTPKYIERHHLNKAYYETGDDCTSFDIVSEDWVEDLLEEIDRLRSLLREKEKRER